MFSKMFSVAARMRDFVEARTHAPRRNVSLPVRVSLAGPRRVQSGPLPPVSELRQTLLGHTRDISENGLAVTLPAIRLGSYYLTDSELKIRIELSLPDSTLELEVSPARYECLDNEEGYLVGMRVTQMNVADRTRFNDFLQTLGEKKSGKIQIQITPKLNKASASVSVSH